MCRTSVIVCWEHNWRECPPEIEVIELCSQIEDAEQIDEEVRHDRKLTEWQLFAQKHRRRGLSLAEIATLWKQQKDHGDQQ